jgi:uncharacterized membrane protein YbhN (UPF0104 family)
MERPLLRAIQATVTVLCLAVLWQVADGKLALQQVAGASPLWIIAALSALTLQTLLSALRWRLTAGQLGITLPWRAAVGEYYLSQLVNQMLPGGVLGDAGRAVRARAQAGLLASGQAVLFERLAGQIGLLLVFGAGVAGTQLLPGGFHWPGGLPLPVTLLLSVVAGATLLLCLWGLTLPARISRDELQGPVRRKFLELGAAFAHAVVAPEVRAWQLVTSLGTAICNIAAFAFCAAAIGLPLSPGAAQVLVPIILLSMLLPISLSGWGLREGMALSLLPLAGATASQGLAASIAFGLALVVAALPGLLPLSFATAPRAVES